MAKKNRKPIPQLVIEIADEIGHTISPSQLNTYARCPHRWHLSYICGFKNAGNVHMAAGRVLHKVFEVVTKNYNQNDIIAMANDGKGVLGDRIEEMCVDVIQKDWRYLTRHIAKQFGETEEWRFWEFFKYVGDMEEAARLFIPQSELDMKDESKGYHFIVDRFYEEIPAGMYVNQDACPMIHDFKPSGWDYTTDLNRQLTFMAIMKDPTKPLPLVGGYFYKNGVELDPKFPHHTSVASIYRYLTDWLESVKKKKFLKKFGWGCQWCDHLSICKISNDKMSLGELLQARRERRKVYANEGEM